MVLRLAHLRTTRRSGQRGLAAVSRPTRLHQPVSGNIGVRPMYSIALPVQPKQVLHNVKPAKRYTQPANCISPSSPPSQSRLHQPHPPCIPARLPIHTHRCTYTDAHAHTCCNANAIAHAHISMHVYMFIYRYVCTYKTHITLAIHVQ